MEVEEGPYNLVDIAAHQDEECDIIETDYYAERGYILNNTVQTKLTKYSRIDKSTKV